MRMYRLRPTSDLIRVDVEPRSSNMLSSYVTLTVTAVVPFLVPFTPEYRRRARFPRRFFWTGSKQPNFPNLSP